jgi:primosomal protein N'
MDKKTEKFIIDVAPLARISLSGNQAFSYLCEKKLPAGTLVEIPLFKRKTTGVVLGARDDFSRLGNIELKKISEVIEESFLSEKQLLLAKFISDYYISPLGKTLKNFIPNQVKARSAKCETRSA